MSNKNRGHISQDFMQEQLSSRGRDQEVQQSSNLVDIKSTSTKDSQSVWSNAVVALLEDDHFCNSETKK